jgi:diphthine-ammonia ligase
MGAKAAVLWTGGKDCCLALHKAHSLGHTITALVTFVPEFNPGFLAHPLPFMALQAEALGLPHWQRVIGMPYKESYVEAIRALRTQNDIDMLVTGDIDFINGAPNWIRQCAEGTGVEVLNPLWQLPRSSILEMMLTRCLDVRISCVKTPMLSEGWVGRKLDRDAIRELEDLEQDGVVDACGENGEYHTMVVDAPLFKTRISIEGFSIGSKNELRYLIADGLLSAAKADDSSTRK